ncbi:MAG: hypothetical protein AAB408_02095 [Patescibacteria group bacterium]
MHDPTYRQALVSAWRHTFRHPGLWLLGLFAAILGQMGIFELLSQAFLSVANGPLFESFISSPSVSVWRLAWDGSASSGPQVWVWVAWLIVAAGAAAIFFLCLAVISQGALIFAAAKGLKRGDIAIGQAWSAGGTHFWRLFFLNFIRKFFTMILVTIVGMSALLAMTAGTIGAKLLFLALFSLAVVFGMIISFLVMYAAGYIVVEEYALVESLHAAWRLFLRHWLVSFEVGIIFVFANFVLIALAMAGFLLILIPVSLLNVLAAVTASAILSSFSTYLLFFLFVCLIMFLGAVFTVFSTSAWTYLFMKMHREGVKSRLLHWMRA